MFEDCYENISSPLSKMTDYRLAGNGPEFLLTVLLYLGTLSMKTFRKSPFVVLNGLLESLKVYRKNQTRFYAWSKSDSLLS